MDHSLYSVQQQQVAARGVSPETDTGSYDTWHSLLCLTAHVSFCSRNLLDNAPVVNWNICIMDHRAYLGHQWGAKTNTIDWCKSTGNLGRH